MGLRPTPSWGLECPGPPVLASLLTSRLSTTERAYVMTVSTGLPRRLSRSVLTIVQSSRHAGIASCQALCPTAACYPHMANINPPFQSWPQSPFLLGLHGGHLGWTLGAQALVPQFQVQIPLTGAASGRTSHSPALGEMNPSPLTSHEDEARLLRGGTGS